MNLSRKENELIGYDFDGDGKVDVQPGESFRVTGKMNLKAIWKATDKIYTVAFFAMSGKFTMPSKNVTFTAEKDLSGYLAISDGTSITVINTDSKTFINNKARGFDYDTATGILIVSSSGLTLSGVGRNIMIYITDNVTEITLKDLTLTAGDMNGAKPDDFTTGGISDEGLGTADKYLMFVKSNDLKVNINGNVTLIKRNTEDTDDLFAVRQSHLDYEDETPMNIEFAGGDNANFTVTANTYAIQSMGTVKFSNMTFTAAGEFYGVNADTVSFDRCKIKTTGLAGADESYSTGVYGRNLTFSDCNLDISTGIIGETIDIAGATDGKITAPYGSAVTVKCKTEGWSETASGLMTVALDKGHSVLFATAAGTSALQALDFEGGENKIVSYPQTTAPDKEYELTKDYCWLIKEKNGTVLINEITFSGK